ncbi:MAG: outer membrane beta-barrel protein [Lysobacter sp.]
MTSQAGCWRPAAHRPHLPRKRLAAALAALTLLAATPATALDLKYDIGGYLRHSDNMNLGEFTEISDTVAAPFFRFDAEQSGARVQIRALGELEYNHYLDNSFDDQLRGKFSGRMNWAVVPERLDFVIQDYLDQQPIDQLDAFNPGNQQQVNMLVAGPTLHLRFNPVTRAQIDARYGNTYAEETTSFRGDRYSVAARVLRDLNPTSTVSMNLESTKVEYDAAGSAADYKRHDGYLGYAGDRGNLNYEFDLGYSRLERDIANGHSSSALVRGQVDWKATGRSRLRANIRYQYADATQNLITPTLDFSDRSMSYLVYPDLVVDPNVFRERVAKVSYQFTANRTTVRLQPYYRRVDYVAVGLDDQDRRGLLVTLDYRLRPLTTASLLVGHEERKYDATSRKDRDNVINLGLAHQFTRHWIGQVDLRHSERDSSAAGRSYSANSAMVSILYRR